MLSVPFWLLASAPSYWDYRGTHPDPVFLRHLFIFYLRVCLYLCVDIARALGGQRHQICLQLESQQLWADCWSWELDLVLWPLTPKPYLRSLIWDKNFCSPGRAWRLRSWAWPWLKSWFFCKSVLIMPGLYSCFLALLVTEYKISLFFPHFHVCMHVYGHICRHVLMEAQGWCWPLSSITLLIYRGRISQW